MQFKTLLLAPLLVAYACAVAFPAPAVTPEPVAQAKRGDPIADITSAIGNGINSIENGIDSAASWGSSVLDNGKTVITDDAGQALTLASDDAGVVMTLGGQVYTVASSSLASATAIPTNAAPSFNLGPLVVLVLAASFGLFYGARVLF